MKSSVAPAYTIGKSSYPNFYNNLRPGPGEYENSKSLSSSVPSYSFSKSPRRIHDNYYIPGPGVYNPENHSKIPGFTLSRSPRILSNVRSFSPGPGEYNYSLFQAKYQYSISKARNRSYQFSESPGPGYYSPNLTVNTENSPKVKFPKQRRMPNQTFLTPAPGQYQIPNIFKTPGYTIPKAYPKPQGTYSPGPGVYEIPSTLGIASLK